MAKNHEPGLSLLNTDLRGLEVGGWGNRPFGGGATGPRHKGR